MQEEPEQDSWSAPAAAADGLATPEAFDPAAPAVAGASAAAFGDVPRLLGGTAPWAHFLAIFGFCSVVLLIAVGVLAGAVGFATGRPDLVVLMVVYPLSALIYFFPSLYLLQYAKRCRRFSAHGGQSLPELEAAIEAQRRFWKFAGIAALGGLALGALVFAGLVAFSLLARVVEV
jgi:hypothetical protein